MSSSIVYASRARITDDNCLVLEVKAYCSNVRPIPDAYERKHASFHEVLKHEDLNDAVGLRNKLEDLARDYDGGGIKVNSCCGWITGAEAYMLWANRIRKVAPSVEVLPFRPSMVVYGCSEILAGRTGHEGIAIGEPLTFEKASALASAQVFPRVKRINGASERMFLAFAQEGNVYIAQKRGARRGRAACVVADEAIARRTARSTIRHSETEGYTVRRTLEGNVYLVDWFGGFTPTAALAKWTSPHTFLRLSESDAMDAVERLSAALPDSTWEMIPVSVADEMLAVA